MSTTESKDNYYSSSCGYSESGASNDYQGYTSGAQYIETTSTGDYAILDDGCHSNEWVNYGVAQRHNQYANSGSQQSNWLNVVGGPRSLLLELRRTLLFMTPHRGSQVEMYSCPVVS